MSTLMGSIDNSAKASLNVVSRFDSCCVSTIPSRHIYMGKKFAVFTGFRAIAIEKYLILSLVEEKINAWCIRSLFTLASSQSS